jgi:lysozyme family protein
VGVLAVNRWSGESFNMQTRFEKWFDWLMGWEGEVYENDPDDPGGETKYGIDKRSHPAVEIRSLTREGAKAIYESQYWRAVCADDLPYPVGEVVADIAVNNGKARAARWLQEATGVPVDGIIGGRTIGAARTSNALALALTLLNRRDVFYHSIARGSLAKFLNGWLNRNRDLMRVFVKD